MEKMNQISVSEFMNLTKTQMYDKAVEMVEKYNRLVDICNDSAERISDLVIERDDLKEEIKKRKKAFNSLQQEMATRYITIETHNGICKDYEDSIDDLKEEIEGHRKVFNNIKKSNLATQEENKKLKKELEEYKDLKTNNAKRRTEIIELRDEVEYLKKELDQTRTCKELDLKGHQSRETALVNALADKNDEIKELKEEIEERKVGYHALKEQLDHMTALEESWHANAQELVETCKFKNEEIEKLKKECKNKNDIIRKAYTRYMDDVCENREEIMNECYKKLTKDDTGYTGFKQYTLRALEAEKGNEEKAKEFIVRTASIIFYNKKAEEERKEEEAKKYRPSEIDKVTDLLKEEVDKKRIVDVGEGVETELGVSRELLDFAIKLMVAKGYHEYYARIPQATDETKYGLVHVLTIPGVDIEDIAKRENIKSLDFDIPCGEDSIE